MNVTTKRWKIFLTSIFLVLIISFSAVSSILFTGCDTASSSTNATEIIEENDAEKDVDTESDLADSGNEDLVEGGNNNTDDDTSQDTEVTDKNENIEDDQDTTKDEGIIETEDETVVAIDTYTIKYIVGSDVIFNSTVPTSYTKETETFELPIPLREGYNFKGWYLNEEYSGNSLSKITIGSSGDLVLYAKWETISYNIYFYDEYNAQITDIIATYTIESIVSDVIADYSVSIDNATFKGWYLKENNKIVDIDDNVSGYTGDLHLYPTFQTDNGEDENGIKYSFDDNSNSYVVTGYNTSTEAAEVELTIPEIYAGYYVTTIEDEAFKGLDFLKNVTIPSTIESVSEQAFMNCSSLEEVVISEGVIYIEMSAFRNCSNLINISIPSTLVSIGNYAFWGCSSLSKIAIPSVCTYNEDNSFHEYTNITKYE